MFLHIISIQAIKRKSEKLSEIFHLVCNYLLSAAGNGGREGFGGAIASK